MIVVIFNNTFDENALPLSNITPRRAKYIDQSRARGISAITGSSNGHVVAMIATAKMIFEIDF